MANASGPAAPRRTGTRVDAVLDLIDRALAEYDATVVPAPVRRRTTRRTATRRTSSDRAR